MAINEELRSLAEGAGITEKTARQLFDDTAVFSRAMKGGAAGGGGPDV